MRYEVRAGTRVVRVETSPDGRMILDGRVVAYDARELVRQRHWSMVIEGTAHEVIVLGGDPQAPSGGSVRMQVDGVEIVVAAADERTIAARRDRALIGGGRHEIRAPMPGLLKAVHVREGDVVERNAPLATLEAMKMENEVRAPARGTVQRVAAGAGSTVDSGALIAVLVDEPA